MVLKDRLPGTKLTGEQLMEKPWIGEGQLVAQMRDKADDNAEDDADTLPLPTLALSRRPVDGSKAVDSTGADVNGASKGPHVSGVAKVDCARPEPGSAAVPTGEQNGPAVATASRPADAFARASTACGESSSSRRDGSSSGGGGGAWREQQQA